MYTLIETAKLSTIDPRAYLADVLARLPGHPAKKIDELLPWTGHQQANAQRRPDHLQKKSRAVAVCSPISYIMTRWTAFTRILDDGRICMTNNVAERALRGIAIGRRNWTFCGSGRRRPPCRRHLHADRDGQAQRRRSPGLAGPRARPAPRPPRQTYRRTAALELEGELPRHILGSSSLTYRRLLP